jgi:hypothetical protein
VARIGLHLCNPYRDAARQLIEGDIRRLALSGSPIQFFQLVWVAGEQPIRIRATKLLMERGVRCHTHVLQNQPQDRAYKGAPSTPVFRGAAQTKSASVAAVQSTPYFFISCCFLPKGI